jgi:tetrahydrodipicolinate N-succinyltransferase
MWRTGRGIGLGAHTVALLCGQAWMGSGCGVGAVAIAVAGVGVGVGVTAGAGVGAGLGVTMVTSAAGKATMSQVPSAQAAKLLISKTAKRREIVFIIHSKLSAGLRGVGMNY